MWGFMRLRLLSPINVLENNLLYHKLHFDIFPPSYWYATRYKTFSGFLILFLAILGLKRFNLFKAQLVAILIIETVFSFGHEIYIGSRTFLTPLGYVSLAFPFLLFFRIPVRAYFWVTLSLSLLAAFGLDNALKKAQKIIGAKAILIIPIFFIIHFLENTPFPMRSFPAQKIMIPQDYQKFINALRYSTEIFSSSVCRMLITIWKSSYSRFYC